MASAIVADTGASPLDVLDDLRTFYFDTALSGRLLYPACSPSPNRRTSWFGSEWPFAPANAVHYFTAGLDNQPMDTSTGAAINHTTAKALFPRLATQSAAATTRTESPPPGPQLSTASFGGQRS
jgi:hypothetical protein